ncbi:MAG: DNA-binding protein WhiA [Erysipelotrichaceae bacterium]|nr:DNA-binding protein WhiA [Erysipelotrichaceae bacterium]
MSFTSEIKQEVSYNDLKKCCARAELSALLQMTSSIRISHREFQLVIKTENPTTARRIRVLLRQVFDINAEQRIYQKSNLRKNYVYEFLITDGARKVLEETGIYTEKGLSSYPLYEIVKKECCARAYIAGCFLAYGACNTPGTPNYHLEVTTVDEASAAFLLRTLKRFNIIAKTMKRRGRDVVYLKKADTISDFLRLIGAHEALMNFENSRISRDFKNSYTRLDNCEIANEEKSIRAAHKQLEIIEELEKDPHFDPDEKLREVIALRKAYPEDSLSELAAHYETMYFKRISRSGLKHRLDRLAAMTDK